jgi:succinate dehydrogenase flavin-adding protein (antitoxin of CptAB toxin-antitoxin module)
MNNLQSFTEYLKDTYYSLSVSHQENFINYLTEKDKSYFQLLITDKMTYKLNTWSIGQHMMKQEELMVDLKKFKKQ